MGKFFHGWRRKMGCVLLVNSLISGCTSDRDVSPEISATTPLEAPANGNIDAGRRIIDGAGDGTLSAESIRRIAAENLRVGMATSEARDALGAYDLSLICSVASGSGATQTYGMEFCGPSLHVMSRIEPMDVQSDYRVTDWRVHEPVPETEKTVADDLHPGMTSAAVDQALTKQGLFPRYFSGSNGLMIIYYVGKNPDVSVGVHFGADDSKGERRLVKWEIEPEDKPKPAVTGKGQIDEMTAISKPENELQ